MFFMINVLVNERQNKHVPNIIYIRIGLILTIYIIYITILYNHSKSNKYIVSLRTYVLYVFSVKMANKDLTEESLVNDFNKLSQKSADTDDSDEIYRLGYCYEYGIGVEK